MICINSSQAWQEAQLGPFDALDHLFGFFLPAIGLGAIAAGLAKLVWRQELRSVPWVRLAVWSGAASAAMLVAGLLAFGRDGTMTTYAAMVVAAALALLWTGFAGR